ncbi:hypothetical protein [Kitasatospora sp. MAP5-34]|uniref:hypothetical protein n=1 Tax=Kitasatospora sp. MAP5-34 TaxID=3035102 RepID=UPI0024768187|nr:hypothetical protein [Kitasatospora sp. MAP5-34]MDH6579384.1 hypothetical protein [Kitasatospora sp. MAP5-34]
MVQRLSVVGIDGTSYCLQCHENGILTPLSNRQDDGFLCPVGEDAAWEVGAELSWEEYAAGAPCRGCGQPLLTAQEAPEWHSKGTMYYTEDEQAEAAAYEAEFRARHPLCHAFRWTLAGRLGEHCMRCCPPPPLSPEQMMAVLEILFKDKRESEAAAARLSVQPDEPHPPGPLSARTNEELQAEILGLRARVADLEAQRPDERGTD